MTILVPQSFAAELKTGNSFGGAELVHVAVPEKVGLATITGYKVQQASIISIEGATYTNDETAIFSIVLAPGNHIIKKSRDTFLRSDVPHVYGSVVAVALQR